MPVQDLFWGARYGKIVDPFGHEWASSSLKNRPMREHAAAEEFLTRVSKSERGHPVRLSVQRETTFEVAWDERAAHAGGRMSALP